MCKGAISSGRSENLEVDITVVLSVLSPKQEASNFELFMFFFVFFNMNNNDFEHLLLS